MQGSLAQTARYFLHTEDGAAPRDEDGLELPNDRAAKAAAIAYFGELLAERPDVLRAAHVLVLTGRDDRDRMAFAMQAIVTTDVAD